MVLLLPSQLQLLRVFIDADDIALGHDTKIRWNYSSQWIWSEKPTHGAAHHSGAIRRGLTVLPNGESIGGPPREDQTRALQRLWLADARLLEPRPAVPPLKSPAEYAIAEQQHPKTIYIKETDRTPSIDQSLASVDFGGFTLIRVVACVLARRKEPSLRAQFSSRPGGGATRPWHLTSKSIMAPP